MINILVVDDEKHQNNVICSYLMKNNFNAIGCLNANDAYDVMYENHIDLIISDIMMPDIDGFEFAKSVRSIDKNIPLLFLTAKDDIQSKLRGFSLEIDDYLVKPVELDELLVRIYALLRRAKIESNKELKIGDLTMNSEEMTAVFKNQEIPLTLREFNILFKLLSYPKKTFTRAQIMNEFWDADSTSSNRTVDVYMTKLRDKFSECDEFKIVTVHGLGYKAVLN
ncbi:MAG: response regulator transcription factor [Intestinibacter bartlettii]|uniref:response regulator transcription factor n=1 Tax=Intestinibacter bartlettii TaxID=261299 RepID=UPI0026F34400|nr:response regulator transcription factor [Intestinibacter bartlettii]MDO5010096.1 response regulator transcription factor [Intestinibacter bartlettii]